MTKTAIITYIFEPNTQTQKMVDSVHAVGLPLINMFTGGAFTGHGDTLRLMLRTLRELKAAGEYTHVLFSDGGDTYFLSAPEIPSDHMVYSTEKACYPHPHKAAKYTDITSQWCYLNGGGWCGPIDICIEFFERYRLAETTGDISSEAQDLLMEAYFKAKAEGFPIQLDQECRIFQTIAFEDPGDFAIIRGKKQVQNRITGTYPAILHGNGRTPMEWVYAL